MQALQGLKSRDRLLALLLGGLMTLGFAPFDLKPLSVVALAALFWLMDGRSWRRAALLGWLFGFAHFATGVYWTYISTHIYGGAPAWLGVLLCVCLYAYMALYPAVAFALMAALRLWRRGIGWVAVPALWALAELARSHMPVMAFPWLSLGDISLDTALVRLAPVIGTQGLSALLALLALYLYRFCTLQDHWRVPLLVGAGLVAVLALMPAATRWTEDTGAPLRVAIVQGNIAQDEKWLPRMEWPTLQRYRALTLEAAGDDLIVWPEVALTRPYHELREPYLDPLASALAPQGSTLLAGLLVHEANGYTNSIIALGAHEGRYDKRHLVPFGEYFPIPDWLRPLMDVLGTPYSDLLFGAPVQAPIHVKGQRIGIGICFEDVFADEYRREAADSGLMTVATNDAWFGHSGAAAQHLAMARLRALETGRVVLRASNTGVSAIIGPDGALQAQAGFFTTELLRGTAQPRHGLTPYVRWGDGPLTALALLALAAAGLGRRRSRG